MSTAAPNDHRTSCHRCGNIRKSLHECSECPQVFCSRCKEKMIVDHGSGVFNKGCPVCKNQCCCGQNRSHACTRQFHCYKKCPTTRPGGINFGVCTPSPTDAIKYSRIRGRTLLQSREQAPSTTDAFYSNSAPMSISAVSSSHYSTAVTDNRDRYSGSSCNPFRGGISDNAEDGMSGIPRDDHGSVDDIEHFFISADDWDRSQFTGTTRFNYEQHSAGEEDYIYGSASSASEGNTAVYVDSSIKDIYPFLSTPTPTSPQSHTVQTSPAPTERTSSLPLPSAQSNFYSNARQSSGILDSVGAVAVNDATLQFVEFGPKLHDDMSYQAVTNHTGSLDGWSDGHERGAQRHPDSFLRSQSIHQLIAADNKTGKKGQKVKLSKPLQDLYPDQEAATNVKCKQKKPRTVSIDHLLADPTIGSSRNSNLGPLESFLSSNYFIKESLNEQMGPFFLQQSLHCHPKAPSLQELMSGAAAATTTTTTGVGTTPSGLTANGKKRYRKHPASISASKIKQEAQLIAQIADRNFRNQTLMDKKPQSSATACATNIYQQQTDNNMMLSSICDRVSTSAAPYPGEEMWTVLRGNSFKENTTVREIMKGDIYTLPQRTKSGKDMTSGALSSAMRSRYDSDKEPHQMADQMNIQEQEDFSKENGRGDSLLYPDISGRTATRDLTAGGSAAFTQYIHGSDERNREVPQRHGVPQFGGEIPIESAIKQASFLDIYDPFQKFDDYYITSPGPGFREAAVPVVNNVCVLDNPWTYGYFNSDESQKSCLRNEPCSIRYESRETQDTSSSAVDVLSSTASSPHRERVDINVDADAGADDLLLNALAEQITGEAEDIPAMAQIVPNKLNVASDADADPRNFMPCDPPNRLRATAAAVVKFTAMLAPRDESQGVKYSTTAPSFPLPSNVINQYREADVEKMSTTKEHDSIHLNRNCSANGTPSKSNPPFDNVSFSPFMNFTPESGNKTVEHAGSSLGFEISSGMLPYNILSVGPYNGERGRGNKDQNDIVEAPAPAVALLGPSTGAGPESALGWLDYPYDFTAE